MARYLRRSHTGSLVVLALVVGVAAGLGAVVFRWLIASFHGVFFDGLGGWLAPLGRVHVVLLPAAGGLMVGPMIYWLAREAKGHGVPEVMHAVAFDRGRIRGRVAVVKSLASSLCIGSGGAAGREGPIVQIGSAVGSAIGQWLQLNPERVRLLVACGSAGGISATFNSPIAGVVFALEVILRQFSTSSFGVVVLASVMATVVSRAALGNEPAFAVPSYALVSAWELALYFVLGIVTALVAVGFVRFFYACEDAWERWQGVPEWFKPACGGALVGALGIWTPQVLGVGYETIESALHGELVVTWMVVLIVAKVVATSVTIGSGGSGGVFAPSLFIGGLTGGAFGELANAWFPASTAHSGAYAMVGMAAMFAAAAHAPMTSVLILFEMTGDYAIILPLMMAVVVSTILSERLEPENIYTLKLLRRGVDITFQHDINLMDTILVEEAMTRDMETVPLDMPVSQLMHEFHETWHHGFPVVDKQGQLVGVVTLTDLTRAAMGSSREATVGDICTRNLLTCHPDETLSEALKQFGARDVGRLPVVARDAPRRLLGVLRRNDVVSAYARAALEHADHLELVERTRREELENPEFVDVRLGPETALAGQTVGELSLPPKCVLISIHRGARTVIPREDTMLRPHDRVLAICDGESAPHLRQLLHATEPRADGEDA